MDQKLKRELQSDEQVCGYFWDSGDSKIKFRKETYAMRSDVMRDRYELDAALANLTPISETTQTQRKLN